MRMGIVDLTLKKIEENRTKLDPNFNKLSCHVILDKSL